MTSSPGTWSEWALMSRFRTNQEHAGLLQDQRFEGSESGGGPDGSWTVCGIWPPARLQVAGSSPSLTWTLTCCRPRSTVSVIVSPGL